MQFFFFRAAAGSEDRKRMVDEVDRTDSSVPLVSREVFDNLPELVKPLFNHWVEQRETKREPVGDDIGQTNDS